jgi:hypothetical protein
MAEPDTGPPSQGQPPSQVPIDTILQRQIELPQIHVNYLSLFRYATAKDYALLLLSAIFAAVSGVRSLPCAPPDYVG